MTAVFFVIVIGAWLTFLAVARTGGTPSITFLAYTTGLLGEVEFGGCSLAVGAPWFPKLPSYQTLSVNTDQIAFLNVREPKIEGKLNIVSFIRNKQPLSPERLFPPEKLGDVSVQFVNDEFNKSVQTAVAWLPTNSMYVGAQTKATLREILAVTTITCGK